MTKDYKEINTTKPTILLVGSGICSYREYLLSMISKHANVWLLLDNESTWENNYIVGFTKVNTIDPIKMKSSTWILIDILSN